ncbi:MAG: hypothetical protein EOS10_22225 [Mesorhizobium sp.]|uniref:hypothetical protein n=1 Tax=Mesorhizobium sp. TaxID=1871066 RepID=UPI000FE946E7|nr:hypothetical protein [Mesorhizobium sp.]RWO29564.1 MAG: hypothetical protein EOS10_22225 [Mesorhizobium sp.]
MPGPYGSLANPVPLDPFQEIVNVHWGAKYLAANLDVGLEIVAGGENGTGPGPEYVDPWTYASLTEATLFFNPADALSTYKQLSGGVWNPVLPEQVSYTGEPSLPPGFSYNLWEYTGVSSSGIVQPFHRYVEVTGGAVLDITVPLSGEQFTDGLSVQVDILGQPFVGDGPHPAPFSGAVPLWKTGKDINGLADMDVVESPTVSVEGLTITFNGKTYTAIGSKCLPSTLISQRGEFWVLFGREAVTP